MACATPWSMAPTPTAKKRVWITGDSYVRRGSDRAAGTTGTNLGVDDAIVDWFGWGGLQWTRFLPYQSLQRRAAPDILLIHCGGNDLGSVPSVKLATRMQKDLRNIQQRHPLMKIVFSGLTQRRSWRGAANPDKIDKARRFVNNAMAPYVHSLNGSFVHHPQIQFDTPELFLRDGVHLTARGNYIFLSNLAESIRAQLQS